MITTRAVRFTYFVAASALVCLGLSLYYFPPPFTTEWWTVFSAFLGLSLTSEFLAVTISETGSKTTMDYVPHLGAVLLIGPAGAATLAAISCSVYQAVISRKPVIKRVFNVIQLTFSVAGAGLVFILLGGSPSLAAFDIAAQLWPFIGSVIVYFALNRLQVVYVISIAEDRSLADVLQQLSVAPFAFDLAGSSLALLLAFLYVEWGLVALLATVIPIIVLRYSYGVTLQLRQLNSDLLRVLIKTIEAQDPYTSGHSIRVAEGAIALARELRLRPSEINNIETAALLHDVGKIDSAYRKILTQEEPLTQEQTELIRQHPERGVQLIESVRSLDPDVLEYIKHHHERYDGTGYPDGLESDQIPLGARIIMVADAIDAMVTSRAYRDALSVDTAQQELVKNAGSQFDPQLVETAIEINLVSDHLRKAQNNELTVREL
jgi:putative nucleotidyltransferase with HDIG domain